MDNLEIILNSFFKNFTKNYKTLNILDEICLKEDLFYILKNLKKDEYIVLIYDEIKKRKITNEYNNIIINLMKLYPFTDKILKKLKENDDITKDIEKYYEDKKAKFDKKLQEIKDEIENNKKISMEISEKNIKINEFNKKYTEEFYENKKIELEKEKEKSIERKKEIENLEKEIENVRKEGNKIFEKKVDIENYKEFRNITKMIVSSNYKIEKNFKFSE